MSYTKPHQYEARLILGAHKKPDANEHPEETRKEIEGIVAHAISHGAFACYLEWDESLDIVFVWGSNDSVVAFRDCMKQQRGGWNDNT